MVVNDESNAKTAIVEKGSDRDVPPVPASTTTATKTTTTTHKEGAAVAVTVTSTANTDSAAIAVTATTTTAATLAGVVVAPESPPRRQQQQRVVTFHASTKAPETNDDPFGMDIPRRIKIKGGPSPALSALFLLLIVGMLLYFAVTVDVVNNNNKNNKNEPRKPTKIALAQEMNKIQKSIEKVIMESREGSRRKEGCQIFSGKSSIPESGTGLFAGRRYVKGEVVLDGNAHFVVPLDLYQNGTMVQVAPWAFLLKFHPTLSNVEGSVVLGPDGNLSEIKLKTTRPIRIGEEFFLPYHQHLASFLEGSHAQEDEDKTTMDQSLSKRRTLFENIPLETDYQTAEQIQAEIVGTARRMEVAHMRRVNDAVRINTAFLYHLGATLTRHFSPNVAKLLPSTRDALNARKGLPLPLAALDNQTLASLQLQASCWTDVAVQSEPISGGGEASTTITTTTTAVVTTRAVPKGQVLQKVPAHVFKNQASSSSSSYPFCFSSAEFLVTVCPLSDIAMAPIATTSGGEEANVILQWGESMGVQGFLNRKSLEATAGSISLDVIASKSIEQGEKLVLASPNIFGDLIATKEEEVVKRSSLSLPPPSSASSTEL